MLNAIDYQLMGANNGKKESSLKGKDSAAVHLNTLCVNKNFIFTGQTFRDVDLLRARVISFY